MSMNKKEEPSTAPNPDQWYTLSLGSSFKDHQPSSKFCTLRYEFKPASIDKSQPGALQKTKDNKINVEFHNNQPGKPKVTFEGTSEDYKENDAVLFFDGNSFRLERLHRAVKRLRHVRLPGESAAATLAACSSADAGSPPMARGPKPQPQPQSQSSSHRPVFTAPLPLAPLPLPPPPPLPPPVSVEVERIDIGDAGNSGGQPKIDKSTSTPPQQPNATSSPDSKDFNLEEHLDIMNDDDDDDVLGPGKDSTEEKATHVAIDINIPQQNDTDDEIADVDVNDDNGVMGGNAAAALRAQVAVEREHTSSSSASSGSESSGSSSESGSGSSSSDSESSNGDGDGDGNSVSSI
ncbi:hypothetical protein BVRB_5g108650 [Beta vulgaris subsp. vulgaris]|uniref:uncharacterized protein LOC104893165 n=1 Tax=Beta vulgaris subsp. vulgaris TaxID=3555 RepID=UPI00054029AA|nr:uncharacterized protein LOC104893165 [Beta vulgaris subsp. vulgaris]KMT11548.1 hypothetical protein BVRB_5g108650 [Beta vulgaris subsp. vulgaris]